MTDTGYRYVFFNCSDYETLDDETKRIIKEDQESWFVHNINVRPYGNFLENKTWQQKREHFYSIEDTQDCEPMDLLDATAKKLNDKGVVPIYGKLFPREIYEGHIYLYHALWKIK